MTHKILASFAVSGALFLPVIASAQMYQYVDTSGTIRTIDSTSATTAMNAAVNIAPSSGVIMVSDDASMLSNKQVVSLIPATVSASMDSNVSAAMMNSLQNMITTSSNANATKNSNTNNSSGSSTPQEGSVVPNNGAASSTNSISGTQTDGNGNTTTKNP